MKLKNAARRVNRSFLVFCLVPSETMDMKVRMSSDVMDDSSMSLKWFWNLLRMNS
jgi:hypothetical protein